MPAHPRVGRHGGLRERPVLVAHVDGRAYTVLFGSSPIARCTSVARFTTKRASSGRALAANGFAFSLESSKRSRIQQMEPAPSLAPTAFLEPMLRGCVPQSGLRSFSANAA